MQLSDQNLGELLKNAVKDAGYVLNKAWDYMSTAIWGVLAVKYLLTSPQGVIDLARAAINLINDMEPTIDGGMEIFLEHFAFSDLIFTEEDGMLTSQWLPPNTVVKLYDNVGRTVIGPCIERVIEYLSSPGTLSGGKLDAYISVNANGDFIDKWMFYTTWSYFDARDGNIPSIQNFTCHGWRLKARELSYGYALYVQFDYSAEYEEVLGDRPHRYLSPVTITHSITANYHLCTYYANTEILPITFSPAPISENYKYHIGQDVKLVSSITGGNGADAGQPNHTLDFLGHGGNGGHGGGGGGASGFCKQEVARPNGTFEIDITQKVGTMSPGVGGAGTKGTAGHNGGCIIFY